MTIQKAIRMAQKKLPILPGKKLSKHLDWAADSKVEAYRLGAEEAQAEIVRRLMQLQQTTTNPPRREE